MRKRKRGNPQAKYQKQPPKRSSRDFQKIFVPRMLPRNLALRTSKSYNSFSLCLACCIYPLFLEGKSTFVFCLLSGHEAIIFPHAEGFFLYDGKELGIIASSHDMLKTMEDLFPTRCP